MRRRIVPVLLFACILLLSLSQVACNNESTTSVTSAGNETTQSSSSVSESSTTSSSEFNYMEKYETPVTITCGIIDNIDDEGRPKDRTPQDNAFTDLCRDLLGINLVVEWVVPESQHNEKLNMVIATGDYPDMFVVGRPQLSQLVEGDGIADLTDLYEKWASPDLKKIANVGEGAILASCYYNDKLYAIPYGTDPRMMCQVYWINTSWISKLGLQEPKSMQDIYDIAVAFGTKDPDGNGVDDTIGYGMNSGGVSIGEWWLTLQPIYSGFHANPGLWIEKDGNLVYGSIQPEVKNALKYLQDLYKDGGIDKEFATKDSNKVSEDLSASKTGMTGGVYWMSNWPLGTAVAADPSIEWRCFPLFSTDDKPASFNTRKANAGSFDIVSSKCEHPEAFFKILNLLADSQVNTLKWGDTFTSEKGFFNYWVPAKLYSFNDVDAWEVARKAYFEKDTAAIAEFENYPATSKQWFDKAIEAMDEDASLKENDTWESHRDVWGLYYMYFSPNSPFKWIIEYSKNNQIVYDEYYGPTSETYSSKWSTLSTLEIKTFTDIIMGTVPIDAFDEFVAEWNSLGGETITQERNSWYQSK